MSDDIRAAVLEYLLDESPTQPYPDELAIERALAPLDEPTRPAEVPLLRPARNQCDGCQRGLPLNEYGTHQGRSPWDLIGCTRERYG